MFALQKRRGGELLWTEMLIDYSTNKFCCWKASFPPCYCICNQDMRWHNRTFWLASHHVEDSHDQYESSGGHGEDQSQPGVIGDDDARRGREPRKRAERPFPSLLWTQRNTENDRKKEDRVADKPKHYTNSFCSNNYKNPPLSFVINK